MITIKNYETNKTNNVTQMNNPNNDLRYIDYIIFSV
jgi:hypothetical protein